MNNYKWLQLFAEEGGDTGASAPAETPVQTTETATGEQPMTPEAEAFMSRIPERAKGTFKEAYKKTHKSEPVAEIPAEEPPQTTEPQRVPLSDLLKDEAYKAEYQTMMDKAFASRFKKYDGLEEKVNQMTKTIEVVAQKYGLDPTSQDFLEAVSQKVNSDDDFYAQYARERDMTIEEARRSIELDRKLKEANEKEQALAQEEENRKAMQTLMGYAQQTRQKYPNFDLSTEMSNETFKQLLFAYKGNTTEAYEALHREELQQKAVEEATSKAKQAVTQSIASGQNRPVESGLSNVPVAVATGEPSFKGMTAAQMREYAKKNLFKH